VENQDLGPAVAAVEKEVDVTLLVEVQDPLVEKERDPELDPDLQNLLLNHQTDLLLPVETMLLLQLVKPPHPLV